MRYMERCYYSTELEGHKKSYSGLRPARPARQANRKNFGYFVNKFQQSDNSLKFLRLVQLKRKTFDETDDKTDG
jgi:hypothetical protein